MCVYVCIIYSHTVCFSALEIALKLFKLQGDFFFLLFKAFSFLYFIFHILSHIPVMSGSYCLHASVQLQVIKQLLSG